MTPPALSVIVPTYNRSAVLTRCLEALASQDCPAQLFEVIVSDDGSTDGTRSAVEPFVERGAPAVRYLYQLNAGANAARNKAITSARSPLVLLINDDTIPGPGLVREHLAGHDAAPDDRVAVLGRVTVSPDIPPSRLAPLHLDRAFDALGDRRELDWRAFFTCNVSVKASLLHRGGLFEERIRYHEDLELSQRLSRHGLRVVYRPEAIGYHYHYLSEREFLDIAAREARALVTWARLSPHLEPLLASLGYEPAVGPGRRVRHRIVELAINRWTTRLWCGIAARVPSASLARALYDQIYQSAKRAALRQALRDDRLVRSSGDGMDSVGSG